MSTTTLLGSVQLNARGQLFFGQPSLAISLDFEDTGGIISLGYTWHLKFRKSNGDWEQFYMSDPVTSNDQRQAFVLAVNGLDMTTFLQAVAGTINAQIAAKFAEYVGAGIAPPPKPVPTPTLTQSNIVGVIQANLANDFKFAPQANGLPAMVLK